MLNNNKIESLINSGEFNPAIVSRVTGINYQSLISKIKTGSWSPNDVEKIADFFKKPISYFFDREEMNQTSEHEMKNINCLECIKKQKTIDEITIERDLLRVELLELYRSKKGQNYG